MEDGVEILSVSVQVGGVADDIIKENEAGLPVVLAAHHIQGMLGSGWSVNQTKLHALKAIGASTECEFCFVLTLFLYRDFPVPLICIQRRNGARISLRFNVISLSPERLRIPERQLVKVPIISAIAEWSIWLQNAYGRCSPFTVSWLNKICFKQSLYLAEKLLERAAELAQYGFLWGFGVENEVYPIFGHVDVSQVTRPHAKIFFKHSLTFSRYFSETWERSRYSAVGGVFLPKSRTYQYYWRLSRLLFGILAGYPPLLH